MLIGVAMAFIFSQPQVTNFNAQLPFVSDPLPQSDSAGARYSETVPKSEYTAMIISEVQRQIISNDLRVAAKSVRLVRESQGQSAEFASLTCQIRILLGKPRSAVKACYAALTLPFHHEDSFWKASTYDGPASLFESTGDIGGAIQAAQKALWLDWAPIRLRFFRPAATYTGSFCVFGPVLSFPAHAAPSLAMPHIGIEIV
jgi:hypothetical protein